MQIGCHFSEDLVQFVGGFRALTLAFGLTWRDVQFILVSCREGNDLEGCKGEQRCSLHLHPSRQRALSGITPTLGRHKLGPQRGGRSLKEAIFTGHFGRNEKEGAKADEL